MSGAAMRRVVRSVLATAAAVVALLGAGGSLHAAGAQGGRAGRGALPGRRGARGLAQPGETSRAALQRQVRQAFAQVIRRELKLDDDQMRRWQQTDRKYEQQRREVLRSEREARAGLRAAMSDSAGPDQTKIAQWMDQLVQAQHRRADLLEAEQKELGTFMTPLQRAQYYSLRERFQRRIQQLQQGQPDSASGVGRQGGGD